MAKIGDLLEGSDEMLQKLVFYKMYGKVYFRSKPLKYNDRKSPAQLAQRQRMQVVSNFLRPFREIIRVSFAAEATGRSALQAAQSVNMRSALAGEYPGVYVDKNRALLSMGNLPLPLTAWLEPNPEGLFIKWKNGEEAAGRAATNTLLVIASFEEHSIPDYLFSGVKRSAGQFLWKLQNPLLKNTVPDVWIAFRDEGMSQMSNSMFVER